MTLPMILAPLFVLVLMTFVLGFWLRGGARPACSRRGEVRPRAISTCASRTGRDARPAGRQFAYQNQFELPVLFYVLTILAIISKHADLLFVVMAWIFVLTRLAHAYRPLSPATIFTLRGALSSASARWCWRSCG